MEKSIALARRIVPLAVCLILFVLFFKSGPDYFSERWFKEIWNFGHIIFFALFTAILLRKTPLLISLDVLWQISIVMGIALILGISIELAQNTIGRSLDKADIFRNLIGAWTGFFFFSPEKLKLRNLTIRSGQVLGVALITLQIIAYSFVLIDDYRIHRDTPLLAGFEHKAELKRWSGIAKYSLSSEQKISGNSSMKIKLGTEKYSNTSLNAFIRDWSKFKSLSASFYNPQSEPLEITIKITDIVHNRGKQAYHNRFNREIELKPGWNLIGIDTVDIKNAPKNRAMKMTHISKVTFFSSNLESPKIVFVDNVKLQ